MSTTRSAALLQSTSKAGQGKCQASSVAGESIGGNSLTSRAYARGRWPANRASAARGSRLRPIGVSVDAERDLPDSTAGLLPAFRAEHPELARPIGPDPPFVGDTLVGARSAAAVAATCSPLREGGVRSRRRLAGDAGDRDPEDARLGRAFAASLENAVERCGPEVAKAHQPTVLSRGSPRQASSRQQIPEAGLL